VNSNINTADASLEVPTTTGVIEDGNSDNASASASANEIALPDEDP